MKKTNNKLYAIKNSIIGDLSTLSTTDSSSIVNSINSINTNLSNLQSNSVTSVNGMTGAINITKDSIGLGNVENTADLNKPISNSQQTALNSKADLTLLSEYIPLNKINVAGGVCSLDDQNRVPLINLPPALQGALNYVGSFDASNVVPTPVDTKGNYYIVSNPGTWNTLSLAVGDWIVYNGTNWDQISNSQLVASVNNKTGVVTLNQSDVGLGNVNNTSDLNKPISIATQNAMGLLNNLNTNNQQNLVGAINEVLGNVDAANSNITNLQSEINNIQTSGSPTLGDVSTLYTTNKSTAVAAINEVWNDVMTAESNIGTLSGLNTTNKTNAVEAINEVLSNVNTTNSNVTANTTAIGTLSGLNTNAKTSLVAATNEVLSNVGTLSGLNTTNKTSAVAAINEVLSNVNTTNSNVTANTTAIGTLSGLNTNAKTSLVAATNEVLSNVGTLSGLNTTNKTNAVAAINEVLSNVNTTNSNVTANTTAIGTLSGLNTNAKTSLVAATNEVLSNVGTLSGLNTTNKTNAVEAINEVLSNVNTKQSALVSGTNLKTIVSNSLLGSGDISLTNLGLGNVNNTADGTKNVLSATKLTTPTTINGVSFDGSAASYTITANTPNALTIGTGLSSTSSTFNGSTANTVSLPNVGTAGTYGNASNIPVITTDAQGRVSSVSIIPVATSSCGTFWQVQNYNSTNVNSVGTFAQIGTVGAVPYSSSQYGAIPFISFSTPATALQSSGVTTNVNAFSTVTGFYFSCFFSINTAPSSSTRFFVGMAQGGLSVGSPLTSQTNGIGLGFDAPNTNFFTYSGLSSWTGNNTGIAIGTPGTSAMRFDMTLLPNATSASYTLTNVTSGATVSGTIPLNGLNSSVNLGPKITIGTTANSAVNVYVNRIICNSMV